MTGNPAIDKILLGINGAVIIAASGLIIYAHSIKKPATNKEAVFGNLIEDSIFEDNLAPVPMKEMIVNLYSRETRLRFLNLKMDIGIFSEADRKKAKDISSVITDEVIDIAGNLSPKELNSITGKILFESRIKSRVNRRVGKKIIKRIYFSKFIIQ